MKINALMGVFLSLLLGFAFTAPASDDVPGKSDEAGGKRLILNLVGVGEPYESTVPDIDGDMGDDPAVCFDVDLINAKNRQVIGSATDCLSNITPVGTGLALVGTTFFYLPQGTLVTRGLTTVQPVLQPTTTTSGVNISHETAAASSDNSILYGTGRFSGATGTVRLGGLVDLTLDAGQIFFDCVFTVDLD